MNASIATSSRTILGRVLIFILFLVALHQIFMIGAFDYFVKQRIVHIAQLKTKEYDNQWLGMEILQYPTDLLTYQQLLAEIKPDVVIETGTYKAGLTIYLSCMLEFVQPEAKVISIDINMEEAKRELEKLQAADKEKLLRRITFLTGSSTDEKILTEVKSHIQPNQKVLVILDSLHSRSHVFKELESYSPLVSVGSYIVVNDTHLYRYYPEDGKEPQNYGGARSAARDFLAKNQNFAADGARDRYMVSCSPGGFLKRLK